MEKIEKFNYALVQNNKLIVFNNTSFVEVGISGTCLKSVTATTKENGVIILKGERLEKKFGCYGSWTLYETNEQIEIRLSAYTMTILD